jgi:hypothetical protein
MAPRTKIYQSYTTTSINTTITHKSHIAHQNSHKAPQNPVDRLRYLEGITAQLKQTCQTSTTHIPHNLDSISTEFERLSCKLTDADFSHMNQFINPNSLQFTY